jgi:uncharacterized protein with GYD domain
LKPRHLAPPGSEDRGTAAKAIFKSLGLKTHSVHYSVSTGDFIGIVEGNTEQIAQVGAISMGAGAFHSISIKDLITTAARAKAGKATGKYKVPNA